MRNFIYFLFDLNTEIFVEAKTHLAEQIVHWGYVESKQDYYEVLASGNCCISTALHEFFGISMLVFENFPKKQTN